MISPEIINKVAEKDFELSYFVDLAIRDQTFRDLVVNQMISNPNIMVYYHCYYILEETSRQKPELIYPYWKQIAVLLQHLNSYHRDFALDIIGNMVSIDSLDQFSQIKAEYFRHVNDPKFMTGNCCVKNLGKIYQHKPELRKEILDLLLNIDPLCDYPVKQLALLKADILSIFDEIYIDASDWKKITEFINKESESISPKTRRKANELMHKYNILLDF